MRAFGYRWGLVLAILGLPILGRGLATSNVPALCGGGTLLVYGVFLWCFLRRPHKADTPGPNSG